MMKVKSTKYMDFYLVEKKPKTNVYQIENKKSGDVIGIIEWYSVWRQYVIQPEFGCIFNDTCLKEIAEFLSELNKNHKEKANQGI